MVHLFLTYFLFCNALAYMLTYDSIFPVLVGVYGLDSSVVNEMVTVVRAPWAMQSIWALISMVFPICGFQKRFAIVWGVLVAIIGTVALAFFDLPLYQQAVFCFFLCVAGTTICDAITVARYTELMKAS